jgi:type VI secretion system protein ImpJ
MKLLSKVVWSEGMYLGPHHFQAQNRYFEDSVHFATTSLCKDPYGFAACRLDADALRNGAVSLVHAHGLFEDGLSFDMPGSDAFPKPRDVGARFAPNEDYVSVHLAVPRALPDRQNLELDSDEDGNRRYRGATRLLPDENTGRDEKPIQLGRKNIQLLLDAELTADFVTLPLVRIVRDGSGHFRADATFMPPCLRLSASDRLTELLQRLVQILEEKSSVLTQEQHRSGGRFQAGMAARDVSQFWLLHAINSSLTPLRHLLLAKHGHPEELFREMSRLAGALCTFGLDTHPRSLPSYDHRQPGVSFGQLDEHIRRHLEIVLPSQAITIPLEGTDRYFYEADLKDDRCLGRARWILGIHSPVGEAELIARTPELVKICSARFVSELVKRALPGLALTHLQVPPSAAPTKVDSQYFSITRTGACWEHLLQTRRIGAYVPGELPSPELELIVLLES